MKKSQAPETEIGIQYQICQYLESKGYCFWRTNNIPAFSRNADGSIRMHKLPKYTPKGLPDIILVHKGIFVGFEIKRPNRYQTPEQKNMENWITQNGGIYKVIRCLQDLQAMGY